MVRRYRHHYSLTFFSTIHRLIRISSHNLNYLIGFGAIIQYVDIYFFVIPTTNQQVVAALCNVGTFCFSISVSQIKVPLLNCGDDVLQNSRVRVIWNPINFILHRIAV